MKQIYSAFIILDVPIINRCLQEFVESWNHHRISSEHNRTPYQVHVIGSLPSTQLDLNVGDNTLCSVRPRKNPKEYLPSAALFSQSCLHRLLTFCIVVETWGLGPSNMPMFQLADYVLINDYCALLHNL